MGLCEVRDIERAKAYDILPEARKKYAEEMSHKLGIDVEAVDSIEAAAKGSDIVVTCTPSSKPYLKGEWIDRGTHVSAVGADTAAKRELESGLIKKFDKLVVDFIPQALVVGEFAGPISEGVIKKENIYAELGDIVVGKKKGRERDNEITLFKATGLAIEDVITASKVYDLAKQKRIGKEI